MPAYSDFVLDKKMQYKLGWVSGGILGAQVLLCTTLIVGSGLYSIKLLIIKLYNICLAKKRKIELALR